MEQEYRPEGEFLSIQAQDFIEESPVLTVSIWNPDS